MPALLHRYATPFITGLFLISLISGVALYFHVGPAALHPMHEVLSMVLILPFVLHIWRNIRPMMAYLRRPPMGIALATSVVAAALFFLPAGTGGTAGGPPQFALAAQMMTAAPAQVAPVLHTTPEALVAKLQAAGYAGASAEQPLRDIAKAAGKTDAALAAVLVQQGS